MKLIDPCGFNCRIIFTPNNLGQPMIDMVTGLLHIVVCSKHPCLPFIIIQARMQAVTVSKKFYEKRDFRDLVEQYAVAQLSFLKQSEPPKELLESDAEES